MPLYFSYLDLMERVKKIVKAGGYDVDTDGSLIKSILNGVLSALNSYYKEAGSVIINSDPEQAIGSDLDKWANIFGLTRKDYIYAMDVTLENFNLYLSRPFVEIRDILDITDDYIVIPPGLEVGTPNGSTFVTLDQLQFNGSVSKSYSRIVSTNIADVDGIDINSITVTNLESFVPTLASVKEYFIPANDKKISIIHDYDTDEDIRAMLFKKFTASAGGNKDFITLSLLDIPGVIHVECSPLPKAPHVAEVYVIPKTAQLKVVLGQALPTLLSNIAPVGTTTIVKFPDYITTTIGLEWHRRPTDPVTMGNIKDFVTEYINDMREGDKLSYESLQGAIDTYTSRSDVIVKSIEYGILDDNFRVTSSIASYNDKVLGPKELFYCENDLVNIITL